MPGRCRRFRRGLTESAVPGPEWTATAIADLLAIVDYISDDNPAAAQALKDEVEFPGCMADGETPGEAMREGADALKSYLETLRQLWTARSLRGSGFRGAVAAACSPVAACRAGAPRRPRRGVPQHAGDDPAGRRPRTPDLRPPFWRSA